MTFQTVVHRPAYEQVAAQLREAILDGSFPPGAELPAERELCEQFGVSRTTVREALRALQAQGLAVVAGPTAPLRVPEPTTLSAGPLRDSLVHLLRLGRVPLGDLVELRCALEAQAAASAALRVANGALTAGTHRPAPAAGEPATPAGTGLADHLAAARAELDRMRTVGGDVVAFEQADVRFHLALAAASGNEAIQLVMLAVRDSVASHLLDALRAEPRPAKAIARLVREHDAILAAVEAGDARDAEQLLRDHVWGYYRATTPDPRPTGTEAPS